MISSVVPVIVGVVQRLLGEQAWLLDDDRFASVESRLGHYDALRRPSPDVHDA